MDRKTALKQMEFLRTKSRKMRLAAEHWNSPWKILIATILSARTRDEKTIPVAEKLFEKYSTIIKLAKAKRSEVEKIIHPINFYKNKSRYIINCAEKIMRRHNGKVPTGEAALLKLPGVGRKTTGVFLSETGKNAIGVDTHVSYISQKLGWTENKNPDNIEKDLKKLFPEKFWKKVNPTLVRFGKSHTSKKEKDKLLEKLRE